MDFRCVIRPRPSRFGAAKAGDPGAVLGMTEGFLRPSTGPQAALGSLLTRDAKALRFAPPLA